MNSYAQAAPQLKLLLEMEPAHRVFLRNLGDTLLFRSVGSTPSSYPEEAPFWSDVFVQLGVPWRYLVQSVLWHVLVVVAMWNLSQGWGLRVQREHRSTLSKSYVSYYSYRSSSFPASRSGSSRVSTASTERSDSARQAIRNLPLKRDESNVPAPDLELAAPKQPNVVASNLIIPAMPLLATVRWRLMTPAGPSSAGDVHFDVSQATARLLRLPFAPVVAPPPSVETATLRRVPNAPAIGIIPPPPAVKVSMRVVVDVNVGASHVVAPSPDIPKYEQRTDSESILHDPLTLVVPAPPTITRSGAVAEARANSVSAAGSRVAPPPPTVVGSAADPLSARTTSLSSSILQAVPPSPSVQGITSSAGDTHLAMFPSAAIQVVPPPPVAEGGAGQSLRGVGPMSGSGLQVVPPPPSVQESNSAGIGRSSSLSATGSNVVSRPEIQTVAISATAVHVAMDIRSKTAPPMPGVVQSLTGSVAQELPVRLIALAVVLPSSSYFSNYEVFIAERRLSKNESQVIKLVYESLPYQRRLSEYGLNDSRVYKLRVTRDPTCDETLMQMTWPEAEKPRPESYSAASPALGDGNSKLPCYRTTADDYRRALAHSR